MTYLTASKYLMFVCLMSLGFECLAVSHSSDSLTSLTTVAHYLLTYIMTSLAAHLFLILLLLGRIIHRFEGSIVRVILTSLIVTYPDVMFGLAAHGFLKVIKHWGLGKPKSGYGFLWVKSNNYFHHKGRTTSKNLAH